MPTIEQSQKKLEALCKDLGISEGELKRNFFALYNGQQVQHSDFYNDTITCSPIQMDYPEDWMSDYLILKSLDSISDEDAVWLAEIQGYENIHQTDEAKIKTGRRLSNILVTGSEHQEFYWDTIGEIYDRFRQKSYLIGFLTLDPEDLINLVWAKTQEGS